MEYHSPSPILQKLHFEILMKKKSLSVAVSAVLASLCMPLAHAFEPFVVKDIRVEGIGRTEAGTVFNYLPIHVGDEVTDEKAAEAIKALYATGFFKDVRLEVDKDVLIVLIEERPAIAQLEFSGNKDIDTETLRKGLKEAGIAESRIFDRAALERAEQELKRLYLNRSRYAVTINSVVTPLERNRVGVRFEINEGEVAKIRSINILGAKKFKESQILDQMQLDTGGWIPWFGSSNEYSKAKLSADLESIRSFYLNRGYLDANIESTQVSISPDKKDIYITITLTEGEQYKLASLQFSGNLLLPEEELRKLIHIQPGEIFARDKISEGTKAIGDRLGNDGYAFANVNAAPEVDKEKHQVALTIVIDPGRRAYVRRITMAGNTRTRDEVIRREMTQFESAWYDGDKINRSRTKIDRTGFFDEVGIESEPVAGTSDQTDLRVNVKERSTGSLSVGAGYSQTEKFVLSGSISQTNLFGSGNALSLELNTGKVNRTVSMSYTNPYYTPEGISRGFDVYHRTVDPSSLLIAKYKSSSTGGGIRFGYPIAEDDRINFGLSIDRTHITTFDESPQIYKDFVSRFGASTTTLAGTIGWSRDGRDSVTYPTSGTYQRLFNEIAIPPAELKYARITYQLQHFFPLSKAFTLMLNSDLGYAHGYGGSELPFFKNFFAGGIGSVRGYKDSSLGPRVLDSAGNPTDDALGGNRRVVANAELLFPMPGMKSNDRSVRLSTFFDAGQVWGASEKLQFSDLRYSAGVSVTWVSPLGPMKFSLGKALNKKETDKSQAFQFQLGTVF